MRCYKEKTKSFLTEGKRKGLLHWLVSEFLFCVFSLMGFKWKPQSLNSCHTDPQTDIQFQSKPAQISTASQHLNSGLSQLLDHYTPLEWSWFPVNGIHAFVKRGSERNGCQRKKRENLISHSPSETFSLCTQLADTKLLLSGESGVNRVLLRSRDKATGNLRAFSHTLIQIFTRDVYIKG